MSVKLMTAVWQLKLNHTDKLVLLALADNASDEGVCWPSIRTLSRKTCLSPRGVQTAIARLNNTQFLKITFRKIDNKNNQSNLFLLTLPEVIHTLPHAVHPPPAGYAPPSRTRCTPLLHSVHPEPSYEPSTEPSLKNGFSKKKGNSHAKRKPTSGAEALESIIENIKNNPLDFGGIE